MSTTHPDIQREAERRAKLAGIPAALIAPFIEAEVIKRPVKIEYENIGYPRLAEVRWMDTQSILVINMEHPWVQHMMLGRETTPQLRAQLEVVLWCLYEADTREPGKRAFLDAEAYQWSTQLWTATNVLFEPDPKTGLNMFGQDPYDDVDDSDFEPDELDDEPEEG